MQESRITWDNHIRLFPQCFSERLLWILIPARMTKLPQLTLTETVTLHTPFPIPYPKSVRPCVISLPFSIVRIFKILWMIHSHILWMIKLSSDKIKALPFD